MAFDPSRLVRQYGDPEDEARACRSECALFDFSFIARARVSGPDALAAIAHLTPRPLEHLRPGRIAYALREDAVGQLVSDLTIWRHGDHYEVMSGRSEDIADLLDAAPADCRVEDLSDSHAIFALQGPKSLDVLAPHLDAEAIARLSYFAFTKARLRDVPCMVGRLGYTGEQGFEIVLPRAAARQVWDDLARRACPAGFAAADILRIEAGFVLFANEFQVPVTASEAGLQRFADMRRDPRERNISLVCFTAATREKPVLWRPGAPVARPLAGILTITSACHSVVANGTLGLGFALRADLDAGRRLADPRGRFADIRVAPLPFYDRGKRRPRAGWGRRQLR